MIQQFKSFRYRVLEHKNDNTIFSTSSEILMRQKLREEQIKQTIYYGMLRGCCELQQ
jgi:hypothetical protein